MPINFAVPSRPFFGPPEAEIRSPEQTKPSSFQLSEADGRWPVRNPRPEQTKPISRKSEFGIRIRRSILPNEANVSLGILVKITESGCPFRAFAPLTGGCVRSIAEFLRLENPPPAETQISGFVPIGSTN